MHGSPVRTNTDIPLGAKTCAIIRCLPMKYMAVWDRRFLQKKHRFCPHSPFSASKTSADMIVMAYRDTYKMPVTITRCSNNYGPYHFSRETDSAYHQEHSGGQEASCLRRQGNNVRWQQYVEDHCKAIDLVVRRGPNGEVYNIGGHNEKQNIEIVKLLPLPPSIRWWPENPEYRKLLKEGRNGRERRNQHWLD